MYYLHDAWAYTYIILLYAPVYTCVILHDARAYTCIILDDVRAYSCIILQYDPKGTLVWILIRLLVWNASTWKSLSESKHLAPLSSSLSLISMETATSSELCARNTWNSHFLRSSVTLCIVDTWLWTTSSATSSNHFSPPPPPPPPFLIIIIIITIIMIMIIIYIIDRVYFLRELFLHYYLHRCILWDIVCLCIS